MGLWSLLIFMLASRRVMASAQSLSCPSMPPIGLGCFMMDPEKIHDAILSAIKLGYRRIDNAAVYFNEDKVGDALEVAMKEGLVKREELYIVSKLASPFHRKEHVKLALQKTLNDLKLDYLDLYLIHWPVAFKYVPIDPAERGFKDEAIDDSDDGKNIDPDVSVHETWEAMEDLISEGLVKQIGVSNFPAMLLHELLSRARIPPGVNQCEGHPYLQQTKLLRYCEKRGIHFQVYSPLGTPGYKEEGEPSVLEDETIQRIAKRHNATTAQVCIAWAIRRGTSVVAKSTSIEHQRMNLGALDIELTDDDMAAIAAIERNHRFFRPEDWWPEYEMAVFD